MSRITYTTDHRFKCRTDADFIKLALATKHQAADLALVDVEWRLEVAARLIGQHQVGTDKERSQIVGLSILAPGDAHHHQSGRIRTAGSDAGPLHFAVLHHHGLILVA